MLNLLSSFLLQVQSVFNENQLDSMMMMFLHLYEHGIYIIGIFWGLWLYPFGMLVFKSNFLPKIIGVFLIIGCFAYLTDSFVSLLMPYYKEIISPVLIIPLALGEFSIIFWLIIKGAKTSNSHIGKPDNNV